MKGRILLAYLIVFLLVGNVNAVPKDINTEHKISFEKILKSVLVDTLKTLSAFNSKLANYFVEHHPVLENTYQRIKEEAKAKNKDDQNKRNERKDFKGHHHSPIKIIRPVQVELAEFNEQPIQNKMQAKNIATGTLTAKKVISREIRAKKIIADDVTVKGNYGKIPSFRFNTGLQMNPTPFSLHQKHDQAFGMANMFNKHHIEQARTKTSIEDVIAQRKQFPGRNDKPNMSSARKSKPRSHSRVDQSHIDAYPTTIVRKSDNKNIKPVASKDEPVFDDLSENGEPESEYYYDTSSEEATSTSGDLTAREIISRNMAADFVRAKRVNVGHVIADDVVVSRRFS